MTECFLASYLEITCRRGKPFAAYLYLPRRPTDSAATTKRHHHFLVDYSADGRPIGVEFTEIRAVNLARLNQILQIDPAEQLSADDLAPLTAA
jgi:hypothetical protein